MYKDEDLSHESHNTKVIPLALERENLNHKLIVKVISREEGAQKEHRAFEYW